MTDDTISRRAALDALKNSRFPGAPYVDAGISIANGVICDLPPIDAVPVVRCKNCKSFSHGYCRFHDAKFVRPDGYCYWGERKDGEHHES